jgi:hypothetical protein
MEDVGVEQVQRIDEELVRDPRHAPHAERRIDVPERQRRQARRERPREEDGEQDEQRGDPDPAQPRSRRGKACPGPWHLGSA